MGVFLALRKLEYASWATVRPTLSGGIAQTLLQLPSLCIDELDHEHGPNVATKH